MDVCCFKPPHTKWKDLGSHVVQVWGEPLTAFLISAQTRVTVASGQRPGSIRPALKRLDGCESPVEDKKVWHFS